MSLYTADRRFYLSDAAGANLYGPLTYLVAKASAPPVLLHPTLFLVPWAARHLAPHPASRSFEPSTAVRAVVARLRAPSLQVVATTPFHLLTSLVFCLVVSGMAGMRRGLPLAHATCISTLLSLVSSQVLHAATAIAPNQDVAFMLAIAWTAVNLMLSGYFIRFDQVRAPPSAPGLEQAQSP